MKQLIPLFKLGLGTRLGDGRQYFPVVSLRDWLGAAVHLVEHDSASGPFNVCCPVTPTNQEFTDALAQALGRKARLAAPSVVIRKAAGALAPEALGSMRARAGCPGRRRATHSATSTSARSSRRPCPND